MKIVGRIFNETKKKLDNIVWVEHMGPVADI